MGSKTKEEFRESLSKMSLWQLEFAQYLWLVAPTFFFFSWKNNSFYRIQNNKNLCLFNWYRLNCSICKDQVSLPYIQCAVPGLCSNSSFILWLCCLLTEFGAVGLLPSWAYSCCLELEDKAQSNLPSSSPPPISTVKSRERNTGFFPMGCCALVLVLSTWLKLQ